MKSTVSHKEDGKLQNGVGKEVVLSDREKQVRTTSPFAADFVNEHGREVVNGSLPQMDIQNMESHLNTIRSRFLTTAAHEFRTPLSTILSSAELAEKYLSVGDTNRLEAHLGKIKLAALQITGILNDFLSLSKLEEGKITWQPESFDLCVFCSDLMEEMRGLTKPGQDLFFQQEGLQCQVMLDKKLLREVIFNLILNAIKYSEKAVHLSCIYDGKMIEIQVRDEGIGIPQDEQKFIFERFFRANNAVNIPGTGIGLNLIKKYLELMNGSISFESTEGAGSTFFVKIPISSL